MRTRLVLVGLCWLSACSLTPESPAPVTLAESPSSAAPAALATPVETVNVDAIDNGMVCEKERRPGSRIAETVCFTREEYAVIAQQRKEQAEAYAQALDQDQRNREMAQDQMERERRSRQIPVR